MGRWVGRDWRDEEKIDYDWVGDAKWDGGVMVDCVTFLCLCLVFV